MFKLFGKRVFRVLFIVAIFFACLKGVKADSSWYSDLVADISLYSHCSGRNCIPLCIYSDKKTGYFGIGGTSYVEKALIGYSVDQESYKWEINFLHDNAFAADNLEFVYGLNLPKNNILWSGETQTWENSEGYKNLTERFVCPGHLYINDNEKDKSSEKLCFDLSDISANEENGSFSSKCELNKFAVSSPASLESGDFNFTHLVLTYSFIGDNYTNVVNDTVSETMAELNKTPDYSLLSIADSEFSYSDSLTEENCLYLGKKLSNVSAYSTRIITLENEQSFIKNNINPILKSKATSYGVKYPERYDFDILSKAMTKLDGTFRNLGEPSVSFSELYTVYPKRMASIVSKAASTCNATYNMSIKYDENEIRESFIDKHTKLNEIDNIRFDDEYDCGFLSSIEGIISTGYFIIELLSIVILFVFTVLDYAKVILNGDADQMKKSNGNLFKRIIIVVVIFLLPAILNVALKLFKIEGFNSEHPLCVEIKK